MDIIIGSKNEHKIKEINDSLGTSYKGVDADIVEPIENGKTLKENAFIKAVYYYGIYNKAVIADDTGFYVKALNNDPGINAKRFSGGTPKDNNNLVLKLLSGKKQRNAYFKAVLCLYINPSKYYFFSGKVKGKVITYIENENSFGYDSIFYCNKCKKIFSTLSTDEKNKVSHRGKALTKLKRKLENE
ncbi:MAG: RdgB/HAM1 family non-canonical purine NTP pyrophosphatase [Acholeplasmatales bacterium]|jgi:XTP/dITP diphosphohydrolase|nr:RdgB/HAM1 family non-canonical purine NTP pyrophosphatase [Acholeplasmatales bacterium]